MMVDPARAAATVQHGGAAFHFCSPGCARRFQTDPARFLTSSTSAGLPMAGHGAMETTTMTTTPDAKGNGWRAYLPLITVFALLAAATAVLALRDAADGIPFADLLPTTIARFMAGFFLVFAGFKLMDLRGFADGYSTYDLLASRLPAYGFVYPFIELGFGLTMLFGYHDAPLLWAEIAVMGFSGVGVAIKLAKNEPFTCACLGTFLKVPLTKVTLVEDFGMAALAGLLLVL